MQRIHLDHNATTPLRPEARARWLEVVDELPGNPSSLHASGRRARAIIDQAREQVAAALGAHEDEISFTSGGTESNNWALQGLIRPSNGQAALISTQIEHSSVLMPAKALEAQGAELRLLEVDSEGQPDLQALEHALGQRTWDLVSIMAANNEVGTVPDLESIAELLRQKGAQARFHTDAVQSLGKIPVELQRWGVDLASFSAHKVGGPLGVGVLWKRKGTALRPLLYGGGQENDLRPGTENHAGIAATACAMELAVQEQPDFEKRVRKLLIQLWTELSTNIPDIQCLGPHPADPRSLPNTLCARLGKSDGKVLITQLDLEGLEASAGSACASGSLEPSHVLLAMGYSSLEARAGLRLSLGRNTTEEECKATAALLIKLFGPSHAT